MAAKVKTMTERLIKGETSDFARGKLKLALGYQSRVGKDTFADYLHDCGFTVRQYAFAEALKRIAKVCYNIAGVPFEKNPRFLQRLADLLKDTFGSDYFVSAFEETYYDSECEEAQIIIITDLRYLSELEFARKQGFTTIKITCDSRVIDRDPLHSSENELGETRFDYEIANNGTIEEFYAEINLLLEKLIPCEV